MPLRPGETFGRYQLIELLGRGAMGEVYGAYDTVLHRKVALKVLTAPATPFAGGTPSTNGAARILREARAAAGITHPNAVSIYDVGDVDGVSFLAMELVAGRTLRTFIGDPSVPLARRIRWVTDVARALGAAHQLGLVHRDIKPENVMVRDDGFVKVLDFGIARRTLTKEEAIPSGPLDLAALEKLAMTSATLTAEGVVVGTPMYMAPEQMRGEALDGRTDQFAWGVLAYEVLTGKLPWNGEGVAILSQILSQEVRPLSDVSPEVPARVDSVIRRAMSKDPDARFPAMEEVADELEQYAASTAPATGRADRIAISVRDPAFAATEQVPLSSAGAALQQSGARALTQRGPADERRPRGWRRGLMLAAATSVVALVGVGAWGVRHVTPPAGAHVALPDAAPVADTPSQMSTNPDATAEYRAGLQALRDGSLGSVNRHFGRAIELDPLFGAAHLRLALSKLLNNQVATLTSADLQGAHAAQASLGTRDRILLDAFELVARAPPDYPGSERILEAAERAYPNDGDLPFQLGLVVAIESRPADELKALDVSIARDPTFAFAWRMKAQAQLELGDTAGATKSFEECLRVSPGATTCLADLGTVQGNEGNCEDVVGTMRRLIPLVPNAATPYLQLANGLAGSGEPVEAIRVVLEQAWDRQPAASRPLAQALAEAALAILFGDFARADRQYQATERLSASIPDDDLRFGIAYQRALLALEADRPAQVARFTSGYIRQRSGLSNRAYDSSIRMRDLELAAGLITPARFGELRERWLADNAAMPPAFRWIDAYAVPALTPVEATAALRTKPDVNPLVNALRLAPSSGEPIGRTYWLGGKLDDAIPYLTQAAASCQLLDGTQTIFSTVATLDLGAVLEERGDTAAACTAYGRVIARWGTATPRSNTGARALARSKALECTR